MLAKRRDLLILLLGVTLGVILVFGRGVLAERAEGTTQLPLTELRTFSEVFARIKKDYVKEVDDKELLQNAVTGMLSGLDPHSSYLDAEAFRELQVGTSGEFGGLGIEVTMEDGFVKVVTPIDDTPAQRAGMEPGDLIIRLDDTPVKGLSLSDAVKIMRGKPGTDINLTVVREGAEKPLKIVITRAVIQVRSVKSRMLDDGYGYLRITSFQSKTAKNLEDAITELRKKNTGTLKGVVLDLRNNPGGVLNGAVAVSDAFLKKGIIVKTEGRVSDSNLNFNATPDDLLDGAPLVVLINSGSASASEIVAGALQDHKRALIMGTRSFGKGSVQTILPLNNGSAVKLTTALYFTPSGRSIQAEGIDPDIVIDNIKVTQQENKGMKPVSESDLSGHLSNANDSDGNKKDKKDGKEEESLAKKDFMLYEALNMLKAMTILSRIQ